MKFRYKVIIINIILLSLTLGIVGYLLMERSYNLAINSEIKSAVTENNLVQSSIEYSLLDVINRKQVINTMLPSICDQVYSGMVSGEEALLIRYADKYIYVSEGAFSGNHVVSDPEVAVPEELFNFSDETRKNYLIKEEAENIFLYVTSFSSINEKNLNIITRRDITELKSLLDRSITDYRRITVIIISSAALLLYIFSRLLTRPLEKLSDTTDSFAEGDYSVRSSIKTGDEVGHLSNRFNSMADSVEARVEELNDMIHRREQFVADFTHEIKTPMTSIIGYADTLRSVDLSREEQQDALNYIFSEGKRLESMSMKLFDLLYLKDHPIDIRQIPANVLANSIITSITPLLEKSGIKLETGFEPAILMGDSELLKTVFINLLDNARKASKSGDTIEFTGKVVDGLYEFTVQDHGIGISEENQKRIFDEFFMVDKSRTRAAGGAGLGMSLVSIILKRHDADLNLTSKQGEGTRITVKLRIEE
ncbi:MAG: HAMP domain-containing histidine kinase [Eubacterium sp.]|nr:HAMP domain-containing histidine kinase [Eubacterium sp.]